MKREFNSCANAIKWIVQHARTEIDFKTLRDELDFNHLFTGEYFIFTSHQDNRVVLQPATT
ncbi:MAG: hypothetical protein HKN76_09780 [Saprospiraceae bacterium]|nr:hypothetical protein [Saprospiraceae bacterium]